MIRRSKAGEGKKNAPLHKDFARQVRKHEASSTHQHGAAHEHPHPHPHEHEHAHAHGHAHAAGQPHTHAPAGADLPGAAVEARRLPLEPGEGRGKILFIDAYSGISGDMTVAALVDLGVPFQVVDAAVRALGLEELTLELSGRYAGPLFVSRFHVHGVSERERTYREIQALLEAAPLDHEVRALALAIFGRLAAAEGRVHHQEPADVHFHEVGAIDAIADIVAAAAAFTHLGADVIASPMPLGGGTIRCRHGVIPLPAPATLECLRGVPTYDAGLDVELVTPTGAAIVGSVARRFARWPDLVPERVGWGGGTKILPDRPNALRVVLGAPSEALLDASDAATTHSVLEANVDDMTGELSAHVLQQLLLAGALDAWALPCTMKKGRPGLVVAALVTHSATARVAEVFLRETSSIGLRHYAVARSERPRHMITVETRYGAIPVKVALGPYGPPQLKPEFEVCVERARAAQVPLKEVLAEALAVARAEVGR